MFATGMLPDEPQAKITFDRWIAEFRSMALACGIADDTYARVMEGLRPDTTGLAIAAQNFQRTAGISPADGYPGVRLLARLRNGS